MTLETLFLVIAIAALGSMSLVVNMKSGPGLLKLTTYALLLGSMLAIAGLITASLLGWSAP